VSVTNRPAMQVLVDEAVAATSASTGWLLVVSGGGAVVGAASGGASEGAGTSVGLDGSRGYALASGQPTALVPSPTDASNRGIAGHSGVPSALLVAPGSDGRVLLEVADKVGGGAFTFEDIEVLSSYAAIAEAVLADDGGESGPQVSSPARLGAELAALADADAHRYREVAHVVELLLGSDR